MSKLWLLSLKYGYIHLWMSWAAQWIPISKRNKPNENQQKSKNAAEPVSTPYLFNYIHIKKPIVAWMHDAWEYY